MVRALAAALIIVFAVLVTTETFACPDGCQSAPSQTAANQCNATGKCFFCTGAVAVMAANFALLPGFQSHGTRTLPAPEHPVARSLPLDHPPRRA